MHILSRKRLLQGAKILLALGMVGWLIASGKLDMRALTIFYEHPSIIAFLVFSWSLGTILLSGVRWQQLVRGMELAVSLRQAIKLTLIGAFFNSFMLGAVGGDMVKSYYLYRGGQKGGRLRSVLTLILDRACGMYTVFGISACVLAFSQLHNPALREVSAFTYLVFGGITVSSLMLLSPLSTRFLRPVFAQTALRQHPHVQTLETAMGLCRQRPQFIGKAIVNSILVQGLYMGTFVYVTTVMTGSHVPIADILAILPIGILITALPLSPGGLGVGHIAFDHLYQLIGLDGGANIFNVVFMGQMALSLLGAIPYLGTKTEFRLEDLRHAD